MGRAVLIGGTERLVDGQTTLIKPGFRRFVALVAPGDAVGFTPGDVHGVPVHALLDGFTEHRLLSTGDRRWNADARSRARWQGVEQPANIPINSDQTAMN